MNEGAVRIAWIDTGSDNRWPKTENGPGFDSRTMNVPSERGAATRSSEILHDSCGVTERFRFTKLLRVTDSRSDRSSTGVGVFRFAGPRS